MLMNYVIDYVFPNFSFQAELALSALCARILMPRDSLEIAPDLNRSLEEEEKIHWDPKDALNLLLSLRTARQSKTAKMNHFVPAPSASVWCLCLTISELGEGRAAAPAGSLCHRHVAFWAAQNKVAQTSAASL